MQDYNPAGMAARQRWMGSGMVLALHVLVVWGLMSGLARHVVEIVRPTVTMALLQDAPKPPAPPEPPKAQPTPPKVTKIQDRPVVDRPPPAFVPKVEVQVANSPAPVIQAVQEAPPEKPTQIAPPAPPAPTRATGSPSRTEVGLLCPGYKDILESALDGIVDRVGIEGDVRVQLTVLGRSVTDVKVLSGPREYHRPVQSAVRKFHCTSVGTDEPQVAMLTVGFKQE